MSDTTPTSGSRYSPRSPLAWLALAAGAGVLAWIVIRAFVHADEHHESAAHVPPLWALGSVPFFAILVAIAVLPLVPVTHHWWENNRNRLIVSLTCGGATLLFYLMIRGPSSIPAVLDHALGAEYIPFITLLFSLYVISGGINLKGDLPAHPSVNAAILAIGTLIASIVGTTGASMLLIRPLLQTNSERKHVTHTVVFFIFLVSNIGGCLLPIGDPPLFLGYLKGVPFHWTLILWKEWALASMILLVLYYFLDLRMYRKETPSAIARDNIETQPLRIRGSINFLWLMGVVLAVAFLDPHKTIPGTDWHPFLFMREAVMLGLTGLSLITTPRGVRQDNKFNYHAIIEVAALFVGIFVTMQVPIEVLNARGGELGLSEPWQFFWITGALSSFLDNAPTYVVFFETANAMNTVAIPGLTLELLSGHFIRQDLLIGISLGAVFMGANTYIGNGPNFMVKSIAEQAGVKMPSFFGYMFKFSLPILIPIFFIVSMIFMRHW